MKNFDSENLFERYTSGACTDEEKAIVEGWYLNELRQTDTRPSKEKLMLAKKEIWSRIKPRRSYLSLIRWTSAAAVLALALLFTYKLRNDIPIHKDKPAVAIQGQESVVREEVFKASAVENKMIKLSDGSIVILEKGSKLTLFPTFNKKYNREVELEGKAFFDIAHNPAKPFIIYSGTVRTRVLGTAFDITAIPGSGMVKINVIRGRVEVVGSKTGWMTHLQKNMQAVFDASDKIISRKKVDAEKELAWNQGDLEFDDVSLEDAKPRLEIQFGYKILIDDPGLKKETFTYSMRIKESPESFIKSICDFIGASYTIDHKNNTITIKPLNH